MLLASVTLALVVATCACAPASSSGEFHNLLTTCHGQARWAVGDSVTNEKNIGIAGWPNQGTQAGLWANLGIPGATAGSLSTWLLGELSSCTVKPQLVVFNAGINDLAQGTSVADLEAMISNMVNSASVPIKVLTITPLARGGEVTDLQPGRVAFNSWLVSHLSGVALDCNPLLEDGDGWLRPEYTADQSVHLTASGEVVLANCIGAHL